MKLHTLYLIVLVCLIGAISCSEITSQTGFLSSEIYLRGPDTLNIPLGAKGATTEAFLDGSTQPVNFSIQNIRDQGDSRSEQFFETFLYRTWQEPYDHETDTTLSLVESKLVELEKRPIDINPVNGALQYLEISRNLQSPGDIFNIDVKVKNSSGEKLLKDYAIIRLTTDSKPFEFYRATTAILLVNDAGETTFTLYDYISEQDLDRHQNVYDRNGKELIDIYKKSDEPSTGVKVLIQYKDSEGEIFDSKEYNTYSAGTESYFDHAVNRQNTSEGAMIEFPVTPWPVDQGLLSYLRGGTKDFSVLDTASLHQEVYNEEKYSYLDPWPSEEWGASKWYIRLRSKIQFNESGTWVISVRFPYTHLDGTF